jgi:hypothetical protein
VRDGINLERASVPALVISHDVFEKAAQAQSKALGLADLRLIVYKQPEGKAEDVEGAAAARSVVDQLLELVRDSAT